MAKSSVIYLHDVPIYTQGSMDMACGYYCALMFLTAMSADFASSYWAGDAPPEQLPFGEDMAPFGQGSFVKRKKNNGDPATFSKGLYETVKRALRAKVRSQPHAQVAALLRPPPPPPTDPREVTNEVWAEVVDAIRYQRPSILRIPKSAYHPDGHFVVVKGYVPAREPKSGKIAMPKSEARLLVNDPEVGEREILKAALSDEQDEQGTSALIAAEPTWLRR